MVGSVGFALTFESTEMQENCFDLARFWRDMLISFDL